MTEELVERLRREIEKAPVMESGPRPRNARALVSSLVDDIDTLRWTKRWTWTQITEWLGKEAEIRITPLTLKTYYYGAMKQKVRPAESK